LPDDPTVYVNISSKTEPGHAPQNCENWFVMVTPQLIFAKTGGWKKKRLREIVIKKLERMLNEQVRKHIISESVMDPSDWKKRDFAYRGSIYGASSNSASSAFGRHPNFSSQFAGLYFLWRNGAPLAEASHSV
jgi:phytoene dehydrogenase-like protein